MRNSTWAVVFSSFKANTQITQVLGFRRYFRHSGDISLSTIFGTLKLFDWKIYSKTFPMYLLWDS